jgi:hypothetical protein
MTEREDFRKDLCPIRDGAMHLPACPHASFAPSRLWDDGEQEGS